ncbi:hypothetical protein [Nocardia noduli]|uniref:hypothetical protein n=1 Tax=Nocardia noduli TaxID=2815722 RepID=UPI001C22578E|nr:hypothetical protein [Nocardia noduli]
MFIRTVITTAAVLTTLGLAASPAYADEGSDIATQCTDFARSLSQYDFACTKINHSSDMSPIQLGEHTARSTVPIEEHGCVSSGENLHFITSVYNASKTGRVITIHDTSCGSAGRSLHPGQTYVGMAGAVSY